MKIQKLRRSSVRSTQRKRRTTYLTELELMQTVGGLRKSPNPDCDVWDPDTGTLYVHGEYPRSS